MRFGAGWLSAGVAALLLTTGCKEGKSVTVDEQGREQASASAAVEQAQDRSEKAFDQAESAQKQAGDEQQEAARAQQRVEEARRELTEAEAQAQAELQQAQQAQQQAQQTQQQAQQPVAQAPVPSAPGQSDQFVVGQVLTASQDEVMVSVRGEPQVRLQVEPSTQIIVNGRQGQAADIQEGSQVRASYRDSQGEQKAVRIEVTSLAQPGMPATPESGESSPGVQPQPLEQ